MSIPTAQLDGRMLQLPLKDNPIERRLKAILGEFQFVIINLQAQLEIVMQKNAELEAEKKRDGDNNNIA